MVPSQAQREPHSDLISLVTVVARKLSVEPFPVLCVQDNEESSLSSGLIPPASSFLALVISPSTQFYPCVCVRALLKAKLKSS